QSARRPSSDRRWHRRDRRPHPAKGRGACGPRTLQTCHVSAIRGVRISASRSICRCRAAVIPMPRLFTGLEIPSDVGQSLSLLRGGLPGARWIDPENYHVTLRFIGDVDDVVAHEVASMLGRVRREVFELRVEDLKSFGGRRPRAIVAMLTAEQALMELQAEHE